MAVPVPVDLSIAAPPKGWTAQAPNRFKALVQLVASLLSGQITASFLTGQIGGNAPTHDIGPWNPANSNEWWFWDAQLGSYQPSQQGCPVGTVAIWGHSSNIPARWLICQGQAVAISSYTRLYDAIGLTWGSSGAGTFKLPPDSGMYLNAPGFYPTTTDSPADHSIDGGVTNLQGGRQTAILQAQNFPACKISIPFVSAKLISGDTGFANPQLPAPPGYSYPVATESYPANLGTPIGTNQQPISIMPPFVSVHYIIKYM